MSPSNIECTGRTARAKPSWATEAILRHSGLVNAADVATTPMVVFNGVGGRREGLDERSPLRRRRPAQFEPLVSVWSPVE